jgi:sugar/nucleoside kinase (ribokinase family)
MLAKKYTLLAVGELLADFIGEHIAESLYDTSRYRRYHGGSPANLALNMKMLGFNTAVVSCVGNDNIGKYVVEQIKKTGVDIDHVYFDAEEPSSMVLVSRTTGTPDFIPYRGADRMLQEKHLPDSLLAETGIFHTTCWPLSKQPSQQTVLNAAKRASKLGCVLSLDLNYAPKVWPNKEEAYEVIRTYLSYGALIKLSEDDAERFFGNLPENEIFEKLLSWGATLICYTLGAKGSKVITPKGSWFYAAEKIEVKDATGAGDAFWSGFLSAFADKQDPENCAKAGVKMAAIKLQHVGPLSEKIDKAKLYAV